MYLLHSVRIVHRNFSFLNVEVWQKAEASDQLFPHLSDFDQGLDFDDDDKLGTMGVDPKHLSEGNLTRKRNKRRCKWNENQYIIDREGYHSK